MKGMISASIRRHAAAVFRSALLVVFAIIGAGCGTGLTPPTDPPPSAASLPPLQGSYRAPEGALLTITGPGTFRGPGGSGTFTVVGDRVTLIREDGKAIDGHRPDADRLVLSVPGAPPVTMFRVGSAAAQTPEALTRPVAAAPPVPNPDPNVPLDRYTTVSDPDALQEISVAFSKDPLGEKAVAALLPDPPTTDDAFAQRERVQRDGAAVVERLKAYGADRYYRLSASTVPVDMPRSAADFQRKPRFAWAPTSGVRLEPYDFDRKGFPMACLHTGTVSVYPMPVLDLVASAPRPRECFLPVPDEAVARRIEAKRAAGDGTFAAQADLYWHAVEPRGSVLQANLTHIELKLLSSPALDGSNVLATFSITL